MECGIYDTTFRGNKLIAMLLSIFPGFGHLYLAEYHKSKRNFTIGISLIGVSIACITIDISINNFISMYSYICYMAIAIYSANDAYRNGRNYKEWSGMIA